MDAIGRLQNSNNGQQLTIGEFKRNMIIAHKFEGEDSPQGWLGATIALTEPAGFKTSHTLGNNTSISLNNHLISYLDCQQYKNNHRQI